ncbi:MAG: DNA repair protein RadA [Firmicutes bacterium]|nr:DNA repair protein RadA [Bacillota bacterium]
MAKSKAKTVFVCNECGYESPKWMGQCICGAWNSFFEQKVADSSVDDKRSRRISAGTGDAIGAGGRALPTRISKIVSGDRDRLDTGIGELNRVLGGGIVKGSLTLISGEPGIGKSTIIIQAAANIAKTYGPVLYVSGEESEEQIKLRAERVCPDATGELYILSETNMENVSAAFENIKPAFLIIDSIQTMYTEDRESAPGSVSQVRACGNELMRLGKVTGTPIFIVAHVTKNGDLAGPKIIEHLVDCVLNFSGERSHDLRILRSYKNRFGTTSEIGAFEMAEQGLREIENLSASLMEEAGNASEGSVITAVYEGTRPLLIEIQALTAPANIGFARRTGIGVENTRLNMIIAVLERRAGVSLMNQDVYVNVVGGLKPEGTSTDLAVALALYTSFRGVTIPADTLALGEVGLTGELRSIQNADKIVKEAARLGIKRIILPKRNAEKLAGSSGVKLVGVSTVREAIAEIS